ncbi:MAG: hypothetical protein V3573_04080 [Desulfovibrionaceae bacterium]
MHISRLLSLSAFAALLTLSFLFPCRAEEWAFAPVADHFVLAAYLQPPFVCPTEKGGDGGSAIAVVEEALKRMGVPFEIVVLPWHQAQRTLQGTKGHAVLSIGSDSPASRDGVSSVSVAEEQWNWYLLKESPHDPSREAFRQDCLVATHAGAGVQEWLVDNGYRLGPRPCDTRTLLEMLLLRRLDAVIAGEYAMEEILLERGLQNRLRKVAFRKVPVSVVFSKVFLQTNPGFLPEFNRQIAAVRSAKAEAP